MLSVSPLRLSVFFSLVLLCWLVNIISDLICVDLAAYNNNFGKGIKSSFVFLKEEGEEKKEADSWHSFP